MVDIFFGQSHITPTLSSTVINTFSSLITYHPLLNMAASDGADLGFNIEGEFITSPLLAPGLLG